MMGRCLLVFLALSGCAVAAPDADTVCASVYTYLAESARQNGMAGTYFDTAALKAEQAHLALNPNEDHERYSLGVIDGAATIRDGLARGAITADVIVSAANRCNGVYASEIPDALRQRQPGVTP